MNPARAIAVIGTAGRDKTKPMTLELWEAMVEDLRARLTQDDVLVSGGAAWADHLAVHAFQQGWCSQLLLFLPAPMAMSSQDRAAFRGEFGTSGGAANHYHELFAKVRGVDGRLEIIEAVARGALAEHEPVARGYAAMMRRNAKVARACTHVIAYTFGQGDVPADGGTKATWDMCGHAQRLHVELQQLALAPSERVAALSPAGRLDRFRA